MSKVKEINEMHNSTVPPRFCIRYNTAYFLTLCLICIALDIVFFKTTLFETGTLVPDGAYSQYLHIHSLIKNGTLWDAAKENPIICMHVVRYAIYWPFVTLQEANSGLQYILLTAIAFPVLKHYLIRRSHLILILPLVMAYFISFRSVLAIISIGYVVIFLFSNRNFLYLLFGVILSFLSTAVAVQVAVLMVLYAIFRDRKLLLRPAVVGLLVLILFFLIPVLIEKIAGFQSGASGYRATVDNPGANFLVSLISRSTIFSSMLNGSFRGYVYLLFATAILLIMAKWFLTRNRRFSDHKFVLLTLFPGFAAEGLGVLSITMVFLWAILKIDLKRCSL